MRMSELNQRSSAALRGASPSAAGCITSINFIPFCFFYPFYRYAFLALRAFYSLGILVLLRNV
jgi:hypothetical protein